MTSMTSQDFSVKFSKNDKCLKNELCFDIKGDPVYGLDKSIVNGIRRTLLTDIKTCAFNDENIGININKSSLHNEFLKQRIGLIPLYINPIDYEYLLFELKVKCNDETIKNITVDMFNIYPVNIDTRHKLNIQEKMDYIPDEDNIREKLKKVDTTLYDMDSPLSENEKKKIFRPFVFNKIVSYFLLTELKSLNSEEDFEEIELYCIPDISTGRYHARYNNLSTVVYSFKQDDKLFANVLKDKIKINKVKNVDEYSKSLYLSEGERYYHRDNNNEPYWYDFKIQSHHYFDSKIVFIQSIDILINRFNYIKENIKNMVDESMESEYTIKRLKNDLTYKINLPDEDDTTGNILQCHLVNKYIDDGSYIQFCGYKRPHPLRNEIFINIMIKPNEYSEPQRINFIVKFFVDVIDDLMNLLKKFKDTAETKL